MKVERTGKQFEKTMKKGESNYFIVKDEKRCILCHLKYYTGEVV